MNFLSLDLKRTAGMREKVWFLVIFLVLLYLFGQYVWSGLNQKAVQKKNELKTVQTQVEALKKLIDAASKSLSQSQVKADEASAKDSNAEIERLLLMSKSTDRATLIGETMHYLSSRQMVGNLKYKGVEAKEQVQKKGYAVVPFDVILEGPYFGIVRYVKEIEKKQKPILINGLKMASKDENTLVVDLKIGLYLVD